MLNMIYELFKFITTMYFRNTSHFVFRQKNQQHLPGALHGPPVLETPSAGASVEGPGCICIAQMQIAKLASSIR